MKQTRKIRGSLINDLMGNNSTVPEVGKGATILLYSDRHPYEVLEVSEDKKSALIREMDYKSKPGGSYGNTEWEVFPNDKFPPKRIVYRQGAWRMGYNEDGKKKYEKISIIFGRAEYYYDWTL